MRTGRTEVVLDRWGLEATDDLGLRAVRSLREPVVAAGGRLTVLHLPAASAPAVTGPPHHRPAR